jgi:O-antigen/teichoic acid export membrane protein
MALHQLLFRSGLLFGGQVLGMGAAFLSYLLVARLLGVENFGRFMFLYAVFTYMAMFFEAGTSIAAGRLLALSNDQPEQRQLVGTWLKMFGVLSASYCATLLLSVLWIDRLFQFHVGRTFVFCAFPAIGFLWQSALREVLQGLAAHVRMCFLLVAPWFIFLLGLGFLRFAGRVSLLAVTMLLTASFFVTGLVISLTLKPKFGGLKMRSTPLWNETKRFGFHAFLGRLVGTGTYQLDTPLIAFFVRDPASVGFYGLAKGITAPIALLTWSIGVASYRKLANIKRLSQETIWIGTLLLLTACLGMSVLVKPIVLGLLPQTYSGVLPLLYLWIGVAFIQGSYQLPNIFLSAHGEGLVLRTMAISYSIANLILNFSLIPLWGAIGATIASGCAYILWLTLCIFYYHRVTTEVDESINVESRQPSLQINS